MDVRAESFKLFVLRRATGCPTVGDGWAEGNSSLDAGVPHVCVGTFPSLTCVDRRSNDQSTN